MTVERLRWLRLAFIAAVIGSMVVNTAAFFAPIVAGHLVPSVRTATTIVQHVLGWNAIPRLVAETVVLGATLRARRWLLTIAGSIAWLATLSRAGLWIFASEKSALLGTIHQLAAGVWWFALALEFFAVREARRFAVGALVLSLVSSTVPLLLVAPGEVVAILLSYILTTGCELGSWVLLALAFRRAFSSAAAASGLRTSS